jgi:hypothetical protein
MPTPKDLAIQSALRTGTGAQLATELTPDAVELEYAPDGVGETFARGIRSGAAGMDSSINYFQALGNSLIGDEEGVATRINNAQIAETRAANSLNGMGEFEAFLDQPSFSGFFEQAVSATGQIVPNAVSAIGTGLAGGLVGVLGKQVASGTAKELTKQIVKDTVQKASDIKNGVRKDALTPDEETVLKGAYEALQQTNNRGAFAKGAVAGAFGTEYPIMAGEVGSEFAEAGKDINDAQTALTALLAGAPIAAIGVAGEAAIVKGLANIALKKSTAGGAKDSILTEYAKNIAKGAVGGGLTESATEVAQEGSIIALRKAIDEDYTSQEAQLRLAQAAFAGFFGGAGMSGAGSTAASTFAAARRMLDQNTAARVAAVQASETAGMTDENLTQPTRESTADFAAQVQTVLNPDSSKNGVFIPENSGQTIAGIDEENTVAEVQMGDQTMYGARIPGRGVVLTASPAITQAMIDTQASDAALAEMLGYSATKAENGDRAVRVVNADGSVASEEVTTLDGEQAARTAAEGIATEGQTIEVVGIEEALKQRKARYDEEQTREMRFSGDTSQFDEDFDYTEEDAARDVGLSVLEEDDAGLPVEEYARSYAIPSSDKRNPDFDVRFEKLIEATPFEQQQEIQDLKDVISDSALDFLLDVSENDPEFRYFVSETENGMLTLSRLPSGLGMESGNARDAVRWLMERSRAKDQDRPGFLYINTPAGQRVVTSLALLTGAGRNLNTRSREALIGDGMSAEQVAKSALIRMVKELSLLGYSVEMNDGRPLTLTRADISGRTSDRALKAANLQKVDLYKVPGTNRRLTYEQIIATPDPQPRVGAKRQQRQLNAQQQGEKAMQDFDRARENRRAELTRAGIQADTVVNILADEFSEEQRQQTGRDAARDFELSFDRDDIQDIQQTAEEDSLQNPEVRAQDEAMKRGVFDGEQQDIVAAATADPGASVEVNRLGDVMVQETRLPSRDEAEARLFGGDPETRGTQIQRQTIRQTTPGQTQRIEDKASPNIYSRLLIEDMPLPQRTSTVSQLKKQADKTANPKKALALLNEYRDLRAKQAEVTRKAERLSDRTPEFARLTQERISNAQRLSEIEAEYKKIGRPKVGTTRAIVNGDLPPITSRILGKATQLFKFNKTVHVIPLSDLKSNTSSYTEGKYSNIAGWLEASVDRMDSSAAQGRYLPTEDAHVIIINDTETKAGTVTDAALGAILAHEVGHIVFQEEYSSLENSPKNAPRRKMLWESFKKHVESMDKVPDQYDLGKEGFEEWYADQVAVYVYNQSKSAKNGTDSYFKSIAQKLKDFFNEVNRLLGQRIRQNKNFKAYMDGVVKAHRNHRKTIISDSEGRVLGMVEKLGVREMVQEIQAQDWFNSFKGNYEQLVQRIMRSPTYKWFSKWLATSTGYLRDLGPVGEELAKFFDNKSQSLEETGFHQAKLITFNRFTRRLGAIFALDTTTSEKDWASPEVQDALLLAEDESVTDADLSARTDDAAKKALEVRKLFSEIFDDYITNKATGNTWFAIRKRQNYAPRMLDFVKIEQNPEAFTEFLRQQGVGQARIDMVMESLALSEMSEDITNDVQQEDSLTEAEQIAKDRKARLSPGMDQAAARALQDISTADMRNAISGDENGFLVPPGLAMIQYFHQVTRKVEFERRGGYDRIASLIDQLPEEERGFVDTIVQGNLGKRGQGMNSHWRTFNSIAAVHTVATTLLFTVFASVTDLAGIATRMKEFDNFGEFLKFAKVGGQAFRQSYKKDGMFDRLYNWGGFETDREMIDFAGDVGTVSMEALDNMFISVGELDFADAWARKSMSAFFDYTGLQWYTRATRVFATKMGERFIIRSATRDNFSARDERYLSELGLTREQVLENYNAETDTLDLYGPNADAVSKAIARFAEEAIIRPNPAQRPSWANNPYLTIVWQLKSYFYAYGKTVIGGIGREVKNRYSEDGNFQGGAATLLLAAGFMIPLTMVGLEMREYMKYGIQALLPGIDASGSTFRSDYMDNGEYMWEIFNRSGIPGPLSIGITTVESLKWEGLAGPLISNIPFVDAFDDTFMDGDWNRPIPVLNNIQ